MKDAARLLGYFAATILFAALAAPLLFWSAQRLAAHGIFPQLAAFDFEVFFRRALILGALLFLWPLLRSIKIRNLRDLGLNDNPNWGRDLAIGFVVSALPIIVTGVVLFGLGNYTIRSHVAWGAIAGLVLTALIVPLLEETFFRGLLLGILLRHIRPWPAGLLTAALFAVIHFLKAPDETSGAVSWTSGFISIAHSLDQFAQPVLVLAGWATLFLIGVILAHARIRTQSLWLPIGLHAGWIFGSGFFNRIAHREFTALPWLGKNLLVGIVPLCVCLICWWLLEIFLRYAVHRKS